MLFGGNLRRVARGETIVDVAEVTSRVKPETDAQKSSQAPPTAGDDVKSVLIEPDLNFIRALSKHGGDSLKKCFQCGTCSAICAISPDQEPFPRKEIAWAAWGMKDRLLKDPDVWLCHQCNDCSTRCPRGVRPGDVLAAVRQESVHQYAVPSIFSRWVNQPKYIPLLLGIPAVLLGLALLMRDPIANTLGISQYGSAKIVYSYSSIFPHWLLNGFFMCFGFLVFLAVIAGIIRFWRAMRTVGARDGIAMPTKSLVPSIGVVLKDIVTHKNFTMCSTAHSRFLSHLSVFFGFISLSMVTIWVITSGYNFLIQRDFIYPFSFWNPWKILANLGGAALVAGCLLMIRYRLEDNKQVGSGTFFDWSLIGTLLIVVITGFITELLHYARLEPHRHIAYFIHLVFVFTLLVYLPYSKFAHLVYRMVALVYATHNGRKFSAN